MKDYIIIAVIILIAAVSLYYTVKHFKGEGGCCGGGGYKPKRKKLKNVLYQKSFRVEGMHCDRCKARVEEAVNDIRGAAGRVELKKARLTVLYSEEICDDVIINKLNKLGYTLSEEK